MKRFILVLLQFVSFYAYSQTLSWSPFVTEAREEDLFTSLYFPGVAGSNYMVLEKEAGGVRIRRSFTHYLKYIDAATLKQTKEVNLNAGFAGISFDGRSAAAVSTVFTGNRNFSFVATEADKQYKIFGLLQDAEGKVLKQPVLLHTIDLSKIDMKALGGDLVKYVKENPLPSLLTVRESYDKKSVVMALISQYDGSEVKLSVCKFSPDFNEVFKSEYTLAYKPIVKTQKTLLGSMPTGTVIPPSVDGLTDDDAGNIYLLVSSADNQKKENEKHDWIYQFSSGDKGSMKVYQNEFYKNISPVQTSIFNDGNGKVYVAHVGLEITDDKDKDEKYYSNSADIGKFSSKGLEQFYYKKLDDEALSQVGDAKEIKKRGAVNSLVIKEILAAEGGAVYVVWQKEGKEYTEKNTYYTYDHLLVQYMNAGGKLAWQKPLYKNQVSKATIQDAYAGINCMVINNALHIFYADDPKNATRPETDKDVNTFSVVKFSNKDLAGMFAITIDKSGKINRRYINWPADKLGFALCIGSLQHLGNEEFIGTVRKIKQGAIQLKSEGFTYFKLKL